MFLDRSKLYTLSLIAVFGLLAFAGSSSALAQDKNVIMPDESIDTGAATIDEEEDLEEQRESRSRERVILEESENITISGFIDKISADHLFLINDDERIKVSFENLEGASQLRQMLEEGEFIRVTGNFSESSSVVPVLNANKIAQPKPDEPEIIQNFEVD